MLILEAAGIVWKLLPPGQRRRLLILWALLTLAALGELASVASWYPFTKSVMEPGAIETTPWLAALRSGLGLASARDFQVALGCLVFGALLVSSALRILADWWTIRFGWAEKGRLAELLLTRYVTLRHTELQELNSTEMSRNVLKNVAMLVDGFMLSLARTYTACIFTVGTVGTFLVVDPAMAIASAIATGLIYTVLYASVQERIQKLATASHGEAYHVIRTATEALCLVKEARCPPHRVELSAAFRKHLESLNRLLFEFSLLDKVPAPLALATAQIGILLVCLYLVTTNAGESRALLAVFAVALAQLIPEVKAIYRGLLELRRAKPIANSIGGLLADVPTLEAPAPAPALERELRIEGVTFRYEPEGPDVIQDVDLTLPAKGSLALVGETGCGKTTLADLVAGVLEPDDGRITIDGEELTPARSAAWRTSIGYVPQEIYMTEDSIRQNIAFGVDEDAVDGDRVQAAARGARIEAFIEGLPDGYETVVGERGLAISGGQRQRIGIARALYKDPRLLILDEATSALDSVTEAAIFEALQEVAMKRTVLVIAHRLSSVRDCDQLCLLDRGRVVAVGTYASLLQTCEPFRDLVEAVPLPKPQLEPGTAATGGESE